MPGIAALRHPERVRALVLMNTDAGPESTFKAFKYSVLRAGLKTLGPKPIVPSLLPIFLGRTTLRERADLREAVSRLFLAIRVRSIAEGVRTIVGSNDIRAELGRIRCPTLVIAGEPGRRTSRCRPRARTTSPAAFRAPNWSCCRDAATSRRWRRRRN